MGIDIVPRPYVHVPLEVYSPNHFTCGLHLSSMDAPVDIHDSSCNFLFFHPREALLVGCWVTALPLSFCGVLSLSPPEGVVLNGVRLVHPVPCMMVAHTQGNTKLWHNEKKPVSVEDLWPSALVHHFVGGHISRILSWYLPSLFVPPYLNLPLSPSRHLPSPVPGCQVSNS